MSIKSYPGHRKSMHVGKQEHILQVSHRDGETFALCYHPRDKGSNFPVRYTEGQFVRVKFFSDLRAATTFVHEHKTPGGPFPGDLS